MSSSEKDNFPPSYFESISQQTPSTSISATSTLRGQNLLDQLTLVRAQNIRSVIEDHILPLVEQQAAHGIAQTIIALLPSDIPIPAPEEKSEFSFSSASDDRTVEVIGFSSDEEPKVVHLQGQMNKTEFWRVQAVVQDLERRLRESLNASEVLRSPTSPVVSVEKVKDETQRKKGLFGKLASAMGQEERSPGGNPEVGVKQVEEVGKVLVKVRLEEICLRTVNEFGLYDTMTKQCVIIRVDARC
ncbi:hypothetical protein CC80DRAFT_486833 [Byssothecium circinans]|uniref:Uncharacterized protein n=1 Tax=Byssothecium circinans TaxID=147558 RepID=A0A6A5UHL2_9PLEO|nr:hypothetical protein CC80DRAFT_486833 [Byssothecium circinans]